MLRITLALLAALGLGLTGVAATARADAREEHPIQLQFDMGGISAGYHINEHIFVGYTQSPRIFAGVTYGGRRDDDYERRAYGQDGVDKTTFEYAQRSSLEVRWSPWPFGLYFSGGLLSVGSDYKKVTYDDRARAIGSGGYAEGTTDLQVEVRTAQVMSLAAGIGYNHVFQSGLSLGAGVLLGLRRQDKPDVDVKDKMGTVSQSDLNDLRRDVEDEEQTVGTMLHLAIGWNF